MELHLSFSEILAFLTIMIMILSAWVALRVKIQKLETTNQLKFLELEEKINYANKQHDDWVLDIKVMVKDFLAENKEEHKAIMHNVGSMRTTLELIRIQVAEQKAVQDYISKTVKDGD